jgi:Protein of unknown function (DUF1059)
MTESLTCRHCKETITGTDEDDLVAQIQAHVQTHGREHGRHVVSAEQVRARLRRRIRTSADGNAAD